jgi:hypothetical protein
VRLTVAICSGLLVAASLVRVAPATAQEIPVTDLSRFQLRNARAEVVEHRGAKALKLSQEAPDRGEVIALIDKLRFRNGTIDMEVSGAPLAGAGAGARGFIGVVFRAQADESRYESFYVRPTNGRAADQLRRNHATQYVSAPDWPWDRLRKESPGVYESYADMQPGEWLRMRVVVHGTDASLYVGNADQPCLVVHDLKLGDSEGAVGLWIGPGTEGYFRNVRISDGTTTARLSELDPVSQKTSP